MLGWARRLNLRAAQGPPHVSRHVRCSPKGPKLGFEYLPTYKTLYCVRTVCALRARHSHCSYILEFCILAFWNIRFAEQSAKEQML